MIYSFYGLTFGFIVGSLALGTIINNPDTPDKKYVLGLMAMTSIFTASATLGVATDVHFYLLKN